MKEVFIVGEMEVAQENVKAVENILSMLRDKTRQEDGCIYYQFFEGEGKPGIFATIEHWANAEAEAAHWDTVHLKEATDKLGPLLVGDMKVSRYNRTRDESGCQ